MPAPASWRCCRGIRDTGPGWPALFGAGSIAPVGWALGNVIEALASVIFVWRFTGSRILSETAERRAKQAVAVSFWLLAPYVAIQAVWDLVRHEHASRTVLGIALTASSVVVMPALGVMKRRLGTRLRSGATAGEDPEPDVRRAGSRSSRRAGRHRHLARRLAGRPGHRAGTAGWSIWEGIRSWRGDQCC